MVSRDSLTIPEQHLVRISEFLKLHHQIQQWLKLAYFLAYFEIEDLPR